jgi:hypothetical protein
MKIKLNFIRFGLVIILGAILVTFTQCIGPSGGEAESESVSQIVDGGLIPEPDEEAPEIGVKDADRLLQTMSVLTGVPVSTVRGVYNSDLKAQLPSSSRVEAMLETHMMGAAKLAAEYCHALIDNDAMRRAIWGNYDFTNNNLTALTDTTQRQLFIDTMLVRFWGDGVLEAQEYQEGADAIEDLILEMVAQNTVTNLGVAKRNIAKSACTVALSSAQVVLQ